MINNERQPGYIQPFGIASNHWVRRLSGKPKNWLLAGGLVDKRLRQTAQAIVPDHF